MRAEMHDRLQAAGMMEAEKEEVAKKQSQFLEVLKRLTKSKTAMIGLVIFLILVIIAIIGPMIAPYNYADMIMSEKNQAPNAVHLLGTDDMGDRKSTRLNSSH